ncbi:IS481 family transposase [Georgenia halophila]|uniref:IS481 family transposase n=1 Tax=Georgenia halophila TaxID=620889 RepID=UPI003CD0A951
MRTNKNEAIVYAITEAGMPINEAAGRFAVSARWIRVLLARYREGGIEALAPRSRRPHTNPNATTEAVRAKILALRQELAGAGLDAGAESIHDRLRGPDKPSVSTIWRILRGEGKVDPQPQKRPRSSWRRFQAEVPNETWQSDFTHWPLADGTDTEIISWLDDHSRYLLHISAYARITGETVTTTFTHATAEHGYPASTLTDNGMVYTTRLARGADGDRAQPNGFETLLAQLGITQKNGAVAHPTTQGKIERFHQTLKRWLAALDPPEDIDALNALLQTFVPIYNTERPYRGIGRRTPAQAYTARPKTHPTVTIGEHAWRTRHDIVDATGRITLRYAGKLRHLGIGRAQAHPGPRSRPRPQHHGHRTRDRRDPRRTPHRPSQGLPEQTRPAT